MRTYTLIPLLLLACSRPTSPETATRGERAKAKSEARADAKADAKATPAATPAAASDLSSTAPTDTAAMARFNVHPFATSMQVGPMTLSPDGALLAAGSGREVVVFDAATGVTLRVLETADYVGGLAFIGPRALAIGAGTHLLHADLDADTLVTVDIDHHTGPILALDAHGEHLVSSDDEGNVHLWKGDAHIKAIAEMEDSGDGVVLSEPIERLWVGEHGLLLAYSWQALAWYDLDGGFLRKLELPGVTDVGFVEDGLRLLGRVGHKEWDSEPDIEVEVFRANLEGAVAKERTLTVGDPTTFDLAADGRSLAVWDYDHGLRAFDLDSGAATETLAVFPPQTGLEGLLAGTHRIALRDDTRMNTVERATWTPAVDTAGSVPGLLGAGHLDDDGVAYLSDRSHTWVWHTLTGKVDAWPLGAEELDVGAERVYGHDDTFWAADREGTLLWELAGELGYTMANATAVSADESIAAYGGYDGKLVLVDPSSGKRHHTIEVGSEIYDLALSPDGSKIAAAYYGGLHIYDAEGTKLREVDARPDAFVAWTNDTLWFTDNDQLWRMRGDAQPEAIAASRWHGGTASADGTRLAWTDDEAAYLEIDGKGPTELPFQAWSLALSPDGTHLLVVHPTNQASVYAVDVLVDGKEATKRVDDANPPRPVHPTPVTPDDVRRAPAFRGKRVGGGGTWTTGANLELHPDARHVLAHDYDTLAYGAIGTDRAAWTVANDDYVRAIAGNLAAVEDDDYHQAWIELGTGAKRLALDVDAPDHLAVSSDGALVAEDAGGGITVRDARGEVVHRWETDGWANHLQFSEDGDTLLWCDSRGAHLWALDADRVTLLGGGGSGCTADPALDSVYVADDYGVITRVRGGEPVSISLDAEVYDLAWIEEDLLVISGSMPYTAIVDVTAGTRVAELEGAATEVAAYAGQIARVSGDGVAAWTWPELTPLVDAPTSQVEVIDGEGGRFAVGIGDGGVAVLERGEIVAHLWGFTDGIIDLDLADNRIAIGDDSGRAWVANWQTGEVDKRIHLGGGDVFVQFSPDGRTLLASAAEEDEPSHLEIWDTRTWTRTHRSGHQRLSSFFFASHGEWFAAAGDRHAAYQIIHTATGRVLRTKKLPYRHDWVYAGVIDDVQAVALSIGEDQNYLTQMPKAPEALEAWGYSAAFSEDGRRVAVPDGDGTILVLDAATARVLQRVPAADVWALAWSGDQLGIVEEGKVPRAVPVRAQGSAARGGDLGDLEAAPLDDVPKWAEVRRVRVSTRSAGLATSASGEVAALDDEGKIVVFDVDGEERWRLGGWSTYDTAFERLGFGPDGSVHASQRNGLSRRWVDGEEVESREDCYRADWDGTWTCRDRYERNERTETWSGLIELGGKPLPAQPGEVEVHATSADGERFVAGSKLMAVVWNIADRTPVGVLAEGADEGVALLPNGHAVTLSNGDLVWWAP